MCKCTADNRDTQYIHINEKLLQNKNLHFTLRIKIYNVTKHKFHHNTVLIALKTITYFECFPLNWIFVGIF